MIGQVEIEGVQGEDKAPEVSKPPAKQQSAKAGALINESVLAKSNSPLHDEYEKMLVLIKQSYRAATAAVLPIFELRSQLELLISHLKDYHVLKFAPRVLFDQDYNYHNAVLSALTSYKIAQWCGYPQKDWMQAAFAGLLHDIGNIKVDETLLHKPTPLTGAEIEEVRRHTTYGYQLLRNVTAINEGVRLAALQHHEKIDGSGYPLKLEGTQIHFYAKIVAVADIFHAMTLEKAYRRLSRLIWYWSRSRRRASGSLTRLLYKLSFKKQRICIMAHGYGSATGVTEKSSSRIALIPQGQWFR